MTATTSRRSRPLADRATLCRTLDMFPIECVVRGYLTGSGFKEYRATGAIGGLALPEGLQNGDRLPEPIYTPAWKAPMGEHDENISFERTVELVGEVVAKQLRELSLDVFRRAQEIAEARGVLLADTKFEFGADREAGIVTLADEVLTSDSSRYWDVETYRTAATPPRRRWRASTSRSCATGSPRTGIRMWRSSRRCCPPTSSSAPATATASSSSASRAAPRNDASGCLGAGDLEAFGCLGAASVCRVPADGPRGAGWRCPSRARIMVVMTTNDRPVTGLLAADTGMGAVTLRVADLDAMIRYYRDGVTLELLRHDGPVAVLGRGTTPVVILQHAPPELTHASARQAASSTRRSSSTPARRSRPRSSRSRRATRAPSRAAPTTS